MSDDTINAESFREMLYRQPTRELDGETYVARFDVEGALVRCVRDAQSLAAPSAAPLTVTLSGDRVVTAVRVGDVWHVNISNARGLWGYVQYSWAQTPEDAEALASLARQMREAT